MGRKIDGKLRIGFPLNTVGDTFSFHYPAKVEIKEINQTEKGVEFLLYFYKLTEKELEEGRRVAELYDRYKALRPPLKEKNNE